MLNFNEWNKGSLNENNGHSSFFTDNISKQVSYGEEYYQQWAKSNLSIEDSLPSFYLHADPQKTNNAVSRELRIRRATHWISNLWDKVKGVSNTDFDPDKY